MKKKRKTNHDKPLFQSPTSHEWYDDVKRFEREWVKPAEELCKHVPGLSPRAYDPDISFWYGDKNHPVVVNMPYSLVTSLLKLLA